MILIADSGSTKTAWRSIEPKAEIAQYETQGINPFYMGTDTIVELLRTELLPDLPATEVVEIHFYGAGCSSNERNNIVSAALKSVFSKAKIKVYHDLLAAARAACGKQAGMAAILGTGSNSCTYNGHDIVENIPSIGFLLGDEGSGSYIGKLVTQDYFYGDMPEDVRESFERKIDHQGKAYISVIYGQRYPNRFLAQWAKWLFQQKNEAYKTKVVAKAFDAFFVNHICRYPEHKGLTLNCVGSVAYYFQNILKATAEKYEVQLGRVIESPIAALTLYHVDDED